MISKPTVSAPSPNLVRVDLARLDDLMRIVGEMVTRRAPHRRPDKAGQEEFAA